MPAWFKLFTFALVGSLCACGGPGATDSDVVTVYDSAGVTIVDNHTLDLERELLRSPAPVLQIGVLEGPDELQLFRVTDVKRLSDGAIAVTNAGTQELRLYEADGQHRATAGGEGRGPSEFRYPVSATILPGDTILVQDMMDRVLFTSTGDFVRRETTDRGRLAALWERAGGQSEGGAWLADGSFFAPIYHWDQNPPKPGPLYRPVMTFVRVTPDLSRLDTLGEFGGILQQYIDIGGQRNIRANVPPYASDASWALGSSDGAIVAADNAVPQFERFDAAGGHRIVRWTGSQEALTSSDIEAWKDRQRSAEWAQSQLPSLEIAWSKMDVPALKPYYGRATVGSDGTVWVGPLDGGSGWTAFDAAGRYVGVVALSDRFTPHDSGPGWLLGVFRDENDVEYVRLYELEPW